MTWQVAMQHEQQVLLDTVACSVPGLRLILDFVTEEEEEL